MDPHPIVLTKTLFYKPHDIRAVSAAIRAIMDHENPPPPIFPTDNDSQLSDCDIMRSYTVDTLFASEYTGDTEEIETAKEIETATYLYSQFKKSSTVLSRKKKPSTFNQDRNRIRREKQIETGLENPHDS